MRLHAALTTLALLLASGKASPADDLQSLQTSCRNATNTLNAVLDNSTKAITADVLLRIVYQIGASTANLNGIPPIDYSSTSKGNGTLDPSYFEYADSLRDICEATLRRGITINSEPHLPVYEVLSSMSSAVTTYSKRLHGLRLISTKSLIRTFTTENDIASAQNVWSSNLYTSAKMGRRRSA